MFDFHEKRKIRDILYSAPVIGVLFLLAFIVSYAAYHRYSVAAEMQVKLDERRALLQELKQRATVLDGKVKYLEDERGIEEEIRNRFDVAKEGEQVIILINGEGSTHTTTTPEAHVPKKDDAKEGFFDRLKFWD
jgi:cell division protein FtsB